MTSTVIALYDDMETAHRVVQELRNLGIPNQDISLVASDASGQYGQALGDTGKSGKGRKKKKDDDGAETGAGIGAVLGGLGGLLVGLGALAIPGIGPVVAAGPLATALSGLVGAGVGAVAGGAAGGLIGALVDMGLPEEQAGYYAEGVRRGGALVTVRTEDNQVDAARDVMNRFNPVDINERAEDWRSQGWQGYDANAQPYTRDQVNQEREQYRSLRTQNIDQGGEVRLPVVEEELRVGKREVQRGGVQVHKRVTEQPVEEQVNLRQERVTVERRPASGQTDVNAAGMDAFEEGTIEVTERSEEPVIEKRARVTEEVVVRKDVEQRQETVRDTVRRTDVDVTQGGGTDDMSRYGTAWRGHYQTNFANSGYQYEHYEPAYQYGYQLRNEARYRDYDWDRLEPEARRTWEQRNPGTWDRIKDAVRYSWDNIKLRTRE